MEITKILELDKQCRNRVKEAGLQAEEIHRQIPEKISAIRASIEANAKAEVEAFHAAQSNVAQQRIARTNQIKEQQLTRLNQHYETNGDAWVEHIVSQVIQE